MAGKYDRARLIAIATRNTRVPAPERRAQVEDAAPRCEWILCTHPIDRAKPRTKHQRFCCARCRKAAFDHTRAEAVRRAAEAS